MSQSNRRRPRGGLRNPFPAAAAFAAAAATLLAGCGTDDGGGAVSARYHRDLYARAKARLARGADVDTRYDRGWTALHLATLMRDPTTAADLLRRGADPDAKDEGGNTPLMVAAIERNRAAVDLLLAGGADVNARDARGTPALIFAVYGGDPRTVRALLARGADVDARQEGRGDTALTVAAKTSNWHVARLLREAGGRETPGRPAPVPAAAAATGKG